MPRWQKLDLFLQNKGVQKLMLSTNNKSCSPNQIFLQEIIWRKIKSIIYTVKVRSLKCLLGRLEVGSKNASYCQALY